MTVSSAGGSVAMTRMFVLFAAATAAIFGLAAGWFWYLSAAGDDRFAECRRSVVAAGEASIGGPFTLTGVTGARVTDAEAITGPTLVYFGYTFCPDFCPTDLSRYAVAADILAERGVGVGQVFVSVDPERDTPEAMADFTESIHPDILGLTGSPDEVKAAADAYRVYFRRAGDDPEYYMMDHSTFTYLMAPEVGFLDFFGSDATAEDLAERVACFAGKL
jgi:protein SCO1/2